ncbi:hypothetical protein SAZ10_00580 [Mesorhizobium sp. BAC0120]|uniref:hypothetical protein n=1 Tax=Mesorhizobium sp. BAC0120 TaxID=3090670 RepID=UPI00298D18F6|nr:hypothetical protein [Mesorhizobium sp. BAC0120]MDW6020251.1 hypothetical protein [Mesorhizobium sp. BAC0120]
MGGWTFGADGSATFTTNKYGSFTLKNFGDYIQSHPGLAQINPKEKIAIIDDILGGYHEYHAYNPIVPAYGNITPRQVFDALVSEAPTPFTGNAAKNGEFTTIPLGLGTVIHSVDDDSLTLGNITVPGLHALYPGVVSRRVVERDGNIGVETIGVGSGLDPAGTAALLGQLSFDQLDNNILPALVSKYGADFVYGKPSAGSNRSPASPWSPAAALPPKTVPGIPPASPKSFGPKAAPAPPKPNSSASPISFRSAEAPFGILPGEWMSLPRGYRALSNPDIDESATRRLGSAHRSQADLGPIAKTITQLSPLLQAEPSNQTQYPYAAGMSRGEVNSHQSFKDLMKVNSLAAAMAPVGLLGFLAEQLGDPPARR